ncbi:MAG: flagellar FlbD family protein [Acidimicrobiales bacterium]
MHKLKGEELWVNPDLIAFIESSHDTVLTLVDGRHVVVAEDPVAVAGSVRDHRAETLALAFELHAARGPNPGLRLVPGTEES